ncbi:MAG: hypothetical protein OEW33_16095 [Nitrospirota bacterium]|nr:hypothetical protein [Nitrospirota bacterium]
MKVKRRSREFSQTDCHPETTAKDLCPGGAASGFLPVIVYRHHSHSLQSDMQLFQIHATDRGKKL